MKRLALGLILVMFALMSSSHAALAQSQPVFKLGFKALADQIPAVVGTPLEDEYWGPNGDSLQQTTTGLMVWRKADNWTAFTNGARTWINGPQGVQDRGNDERFEWEADNSTRTRAGASPPVAADSPPSEASASAKMIPSVVLLETSEGGGSGFAVGEQVILTNKHVVWKATTLKVGTSDGRQLQGTVGVMSNILDMALVRVPGLNLPTVTFADLSKARQGEPVLAVGYPLRLGGEATVTRGIYSATRVGVGEVAGEWVQTDAAINPGNSGGPLVNLGGEVVGMATWGYAKWPGVDSVEGINFALSANSLQDNLPALLLAMGETPPNALPATPAVALEVEAFLKSYDTAQSLAQAISDPSPLKDYESPVLFARTTSFIEQAKKQGLRHVSKLISFQLRSAYALSDDVVAADVVERWSGQVYRGDTLVKDEGETDQPQIAVVKRTAGGWQVRAIQWLGIKAAETAPSGSPPSPFSDWRPGPQAATGFPVMGVLDVPKDGDTARGRMRIVGWVVDPRAEGQPWNGIDDFRVLVDGTGMDGTRIDDPARVSRGERGDVAAALGKTLFSKSGFAIDVEPPVGQHVLHVFVHSSMSGWWYKSVSVNVQAPPPPPDTALKADSWFSYPYDGSLIYQGIVTNQDSRFRATDLVVTVRVFGSASRLLAEGRATVSRTTLRPGEQTTWQYHISPSMARQTVYCDYRYTWNWSAP